MRPDTFRFVPKNHRFGDGASVYSVYEKNFFFHFSANSRTEFFVHEHTGVSTRSKFDMGETLRLIICARVPASVPIRNYSCGYSTQGPEDVSTVAGCNLYGRCRHCGGSPTEKFARQNIFLKIIRRRYGNEQKILRRWCAHTFPGSTLKKKKTKKCSCGVRIESEPLLQMRANDKINRFTRQKTVVFYDFSTVRLGN